MEREKEGMKVGGEVTMKNGTGESKGQSFNQLSKEQQAYLSFNPNNQALQYRPVTYIYQEKFADWLKQGTMFTVSPYEKSDENAITTQPMASASTSQLEDGSAVLGIKNESGIKSIVMLVKDSNKHANVGINANRRKQESDKRANLISADASRLYHTSTKINHEIDKRLNQGGFHRHTNPRESLQSRLLERINTKKQKSPEQIYLEEELSIDDEDEDIKEQDEENDDFDNKTTERNGKVGKENNEDYDEENAADIEDAANNEQELLRMNQNATDDKKSIGSGKRKHKKKVNYHSKFKEDEEGDEQSKQKERKFNFKLNSKQASTVYGNKFMEFRKTFQNFNGNSNKALNFFNSNPGVGPYSGLSGGQGKANVAMATQYGSKFYDGMNKKGSFSGTGGVYGNEVTYSSMKRSS